MGKTQTTGGGGDSSSSSYTQGSEVAGIPIIAGDLTQSQDIKVLFSPIRRNKKKKKEKKEIVCRPGQ